MNDVGARDRSLVWAQHALRIALGATFLSAVADRFGLYGPPGSPGVAWGDWPHFVAYTQLLNWYVPSALMPLVAAAATALEVLFGVALIAGRFVEQAALGSAILLLLFGVAMASALDPTAPFDYSVFTAAAGAFLLAQVTRLRGRT